MKTKKIFVTAYNPKIKKRVPYVVVNGKAISLVTKNQFNYTKTR